MEIDTLSPFGTVGWALLIVWSSIRGCLDGHALAALVSGLVLLILSVDLWVIAPGQLLRNTSFPEVVRSAMWIVATLPYLVITFRRIRYFARSRKG